MKVIHWKNRITGEIGSGLSKEDWYANLQMIQLKKDNPYTDYWLKDEVL